MSKKISCGKYEEHVDDSSRVQNEVKQRVYQSSVDAWLIITLYSPTVLLASLGVYLTTIARADEALTCFFMALAVTLLNLAVTRPCRYTLTADSLNLRCGLLSRRIALVRIRSAELSSSWRNGYALSLSRVSIELDNGQCIVSPLERERFITELMQAVEMCNAEK